MTRDVRRILLLAAESAAGFGLHDAHAIGRQTEQHGQRTVHVVRALHRPVDGHAIVFGHGNHAVGLDVELLLMPGPVLAFDDDVGRRKAIGDRLPLSIAIDLEDSRFDRSGSKSAGCGV